MGFTKKFAFISQNMSYRIRDILISITFLMILFPLIVLISLTLWIFYQEVFFSQLRPGLNEKPFRIYKFITMYPLKENETEEDGQWQRVTPIGHFLRKTSLDELPQLFNILKGDMSFVGPRPLLMDWLDNYTDEQRKRHWVLPGITGWAQINGRNLISFEKKFNYDVWYVHNKSHLLDIKILLLTLPVLLDFQKVIPKPIDETD